MKEKQSIMNQKLSILAFLLLISSSCLAQGAEQIIRQNISAFSKALVDRNYDALVAAYCDDAKIFPNGTNILAGSESIRTYWTPSEDASSITVYHKIIPEEITIVGSTAYDYGYYEGRSRNADGLGGALERKVCRGLERSETGRMENLYGYLEPVTK